MSSAAKNSDFRSYAANAAAPVKSALKEGKELAQSAEHIARKNFSETLSDLTKPVQSLKDDVLKNADRILTLGVAVLKDVQVKKAWRVVARLVRRHPVVSIATGIGIGIAAGKLAKKGRS